MTSLINHFCISHFFILILLFFSFETIGQKGKGNISNPVVSDTNKIVVSDSLKPDTVYKINYEQMIDSIISYAEKHLGIRYRAGGTSKSGFDCSGFIYFVFGKYGISLPKGARNQALKGIPLDIKDIKRGDLVFFKGRNKKSALVGHVGLVVEKNDSIVRFIHASTKKGISYDFTSSEYYKIRFIGAKRLLGDNIIDSLWTTFSIPDSTEKDSLDIESLFVNNIVQEDNPNLKTKPSSDKHTVRKGETLFAIAKKNQTTADKIMSLNNLKSDKIHPGQILIINNSENIKNPDLKNEGSNITNIKTDSIVKPENKTKQQSPKKATTTTYIVKKGDTLFAIAKKNNTTADNIMKLNNLKSDKIQPGQKLLLK